MRLLGPGCSDKVALTSSLWQGCFDRWFLQVALTCTSYSTNKYGSNSVRPILTIYTTLVLGTLVVMNQIWDKSGLQSPTKALSAAYVGICLTTNQQNLLPGGIRIVQYLTR